MTAMTFSHDDIRERLVDYLYGELDGSTRAAFQAHLTSCAACRDEVTGAERARTVAREVVRRPLGDAVPERVRSRALEAARAAVAGRAVAPPAQAKVAAGPAGAVDGGWFRRLRRRWTWTFPTFATIAAMAVFLLVRATIFREAKHPVSDETARELAKPAVAPEPAPAQEKSEAIQDVDDAHAAAIAGARAAKGGVVAPPAAEGQTGAAAPARSRPEPAASAGHVHRKQAVGGLSSVGAPLAGGGAGQAQPAPRAAAPVWKEKAQELALPEEGAFDDLDRGPEAERGRTRARRGDAVKDDAFEEERRPAQAPATPASANEAPEAQKKRAPAPAPAGKRDFAPPPPVVVAPAPAAPPARNQATPRMDVEESVQDSVAASAAPAASKRGKKSIANEDKAPTAAPAKPADTRAAPADPALALASRADGMMRERRWADAVAAYRELLRRYPAHPAVAVWRQRLAASQAALAADTGQFAAPPPPSR